MFCEKCGTELSDGAKFCSNCGALVEAKSSSVETDPLPAEEELSSGETEPIVAEETASPAKEEPTRKSAKKRRSLGDAASDFLASKVTGTEVKTVSVSMEDMIDLLTEHFVKVAEKDKDQKKLRKVLNGSAMGGSSKSFDSADGKYSLQINASSVPGMQQLQGNLHSWITVQEVGTGNIYKYESAGWGKFKKAITAVMDENWK